MRDTGKRAVGYSIVGAVTATLIWAGFVYEADPDLMTMISSVEIQLGLAGTMADHAAGARDANGTLLPAVATLLDAAKRELTRIEEIYPGLAGPSFCRGNLAYLEGRYVDAAQHYANVRVLQECDGDLGDRSVINEAASLRRADRADEADALLRTHRFGDARYSAAAQAMLGATEARAGAPPAPAPSPK